MPLVVDRAARTIAGMVLPYGRPARNRGRTWLFEPGALAFAHPLRLLIEHTHGLWVGRALEVADSGAGPRAVFQVKHGRRGDLALAVAARPGAGLSPGVEQIEAVPDPGRPGCSRVTAAVCVEVSVTESPAWRWPDARDPGHLDDGARPGR